MSQPAPLSSSATGARIGGFLLLLVFLNAQRDGFLGAQASLRAQLLLLPVTALFCALLLWVLFASPAANSLPDRLTRSLAAPRVLNTSLVLFLALSLALFVESARFYAAFGYQLHPAAVTLVFAAAIAAILLALRRPAPTRANTLFAAVLLSHLAVAALSVWSFPLNIRRSDMLPLLQAAHHSLLSGADPYHLYRFPSEVVYLTYLPGTLLAYLPATLLHVDPRLLNLVFVAMLAVLLFRSLLPAHRLHGTALLGLWLLSPYLLYRHELYTEPHWLTLAASLLLLQRRCVARSALLFGLGIALSQFSWVLFPFFLLYLWQHTAPRAAVLAACIATASAAVLTLPFFLWSPHAFLFGVLSHWQNGGVNARPVNLSVVTALLLGASHLQLVQAALLAGILLWYALTRRSATFTGCLQAMSLVLAVFLLFNILVWGYFFLLLELLLLLSLFASEGWLRPPPAHPAAHKELGRSARP